MLDDTHRNELREEATPAKSDDFQDSMKIAWRYENLPKMEVNLKCFVFLPFTVKINLQRKCFSAQDSTTGLPPEGKSSFRNMFLGYYKYREKRNLRVCRKYSKN